MRGSGGVLLPDTVVIVLQKKKEKKWEGREGYGTLRRPLIPRLPCIPRHWCRWSHKLLLTPTVNGYKKAPGFLYVTCSLLPEVRGRGEGGGGCRDRGGLDETRKWRRTREVWEIQNSDKVAHLLKSALNFPENCENMF